MSQKELNLVEKPEYKKIIEVRKFPGKLKVVGAWYLWQSIFGLVINLILGFTNIEIKKGNYPNIELVLQSVIAIIFMQYRMDKKAHERWTKKYNK